MRVAPLVAVVCAVVSLGACGLDVTGTMVPLATNDGGTPPGAPPPSSPPGVPPSGGEGGLDVDVPGTDGGTKPTRVVTGLVAFYDLEEMSGAVAHDTSGFGLPLDLTVPGNVTWVKGGLAFAGGAIVKSAVAASKIASACAVSGAVTVEAFYEYKNLPDWSRVVALSDSASVGNFAMTSDPTTVGFDLRTSVDPYNRSTLVVFDGGPPTAMVHMVETRDAAGTKRVWLDEKLIIDTTQSGDFNGWGVTTPLSLGNTPAMDRPFFGEIHLVAIYDRALSQAEVEQNGKAGADP